MVNQMLCSLSHLFGVENVRSYKVVAFTKDCWISTAANGIHLPLFIFVVGHMRISKPDPEKHQSNIIMMIPGVLEIKNWSVSLTWAFSR